MNNKQNRFKSLPATITKSGLVQLGNLIEEYQLIPNLSENKLAQLHILLLAYYFETKNIIHDEIFYEIKIHFKKHNDRGKKFIVNAIKYLHENGSLGLNTNYKRRDFN